MATAMGNTGRKTRVTVCGGINLDIKGLVPAGELIMGDSNPGSVLFTPGGVARNIAHNIALLGLDVTLLGFVGDDYNGQMLIEKGEAAGINCSQIVRIPGKTSGIYLAVQERSGDLAVAVSGMDIYQQSELFESQQYFALWQSKIRNSDYFIMDTNLSEPLLHRLAETAAEAGVTLIVDPVSIAKAKKLLPILPFIDWLKPNIAEFSALFKDTLSTVEEDAGSYLLRIARNRLPSPPLPCKCAVTLGSNGVVLLKPDQPARFLPAMPVDAVDIAGAGDAFTAGFVYGLIRQLTPGDAALFGIAAAAVTVAHEATVVSALTPQAVTALLDKYTTDNRGE